MNGISAYKKVAVETSKPEDLSKQVITSILSYIREGQNSLEIPHYKECMLNAQMLCVGAMYSLSCSERTREVVLLSNVFDSVQYELLEELKTGHGNLGTCVSILEVLIEPPVYFG